MKNKIRKYLFLATALLFSLSSDVKAQGNGIKFERDLNWEQVKTKAKATGKHIFVDVFATWCGTCKWMDKNVYESLKVGEFINDKFISVKVQCDTSKTDNEQVKAWHSTAEKMMKDYKIKSYPTFLFFSPNGKLVHKFTAGGVTDTSFITLAKNALDPDKQYITILDAYRDGMLDYSQMPHLARSASLLKEFEVAKEISDNYINNYLFKLNEENLFTKDNLAFISEYLTNPESKAFKLFLKNSQKINSLLGKDKVQYVLREAISRAYFKGLDSINSHSFDWAALTEKITSKFGDIGLEALYGKRMMYCLSTKDWDNYGKFYVLYFEKALKRPEYNINTLSWHLFENVDNPKILKFACDIVMRYAMEEWYQIDFNAYDTYANLLYKTGKKDQAIEWEGRAVKLSNNNKEIVETLEKMKKNINTWPDTAAKL